MSLDERLAALEVPQAHRLPPPRPVDGLRSLYHHPLMHQLVPDWLGVSLAYAAGAAEWRLARARREEALVRARLLLGPGASQAERSRFARRAVVDMAIRREIEWRPETGRSAAIRGLEHLDAARSGPRGVILASLHLGPFMSLPLGLVYRGLRVYVSGGMQPAERPADAASLKLNVDFERLGGRWVRLGGSFPLLEHLLTRGEVCHLMLDAPSGAVPATLAGRPVKLAGGIARLVRATGATVVPGYAIHRRGRPVLVLEEPLQPDPREDERNLILRLAHRLDPALTRHLTQWRPPLDVLLGR